MYSQEQGNWCWAAGAKTIVRHERCTGNTYRPTHYVIGMRA